MIGASSRESLFLNHSIKNNFQFSNVSPFSDKSYFSMEDIIYKLIQRFSSCFNTSCDRWSSVIIDTRNSWSFLLRSFIFSIQTHQKSLSYFHVRKSLVFQWKIYLLYMMIILVTIAWRCNIDDFMKRCEI